MKKISPKTPFLLFFLISFLITSLAASAFASDSVVNWQGGNQGEKMEQLDIKDYPNDKLSIARKKAEAAAAAAKAKVKAEAIRRGLPGHPWTDPSTGMEFVWVPSGCYMMGSNNGDGDEKPVHEVCVDGFWMGKYEVTQSEWQKIMGGNPSHFKDSRNPVETVSWNDAQKFIRKLNSKGNGKFRLPTEAEWEYAARSGGKNQKYAGGNNIDAVAWYSSNSGKRTHQVGTKAPNGLGLYDMSGNVWEWCEDWYDDDAYSSHNRRNPIYESGGDYRVIRGGSWDDEPSNVLAANRRMSSPDFGYDGMGFRLVRLN